MFNHLLHSVFKVEQVGKLLILRERSKIIRHFRDGGCKLLECHHMR